MEESIGVAKEDDKTAGTDGDLIILARLEERLATPGPSTCAVEAAGSCFPGNLFGRGPESGLMILGSLGKLVITGLTGFVIMGTGGGLVDIRPRGFTGIDLL